MFSRNCVETEQRFWPARSTIKEGYYCPNSKVSLSKRFSSIDIQEYFTIQRPRDINITQIENPSLLISLLLRS